MDLRYEVYTDGIFGGIRKSGAEPDDDTVFRTFTAAKRELVRRMQYRADEYRRSAQEFRHYKLSDVEEGDG